MTHQVIAQPDGKLAVFSTVVDAWVLYDATPETLANYYAKEAAQQARERAMAIAEVVLDGRARDRYHQFTMAFEEADEISRKSTGLSFDEMRAEGGVPW